MKVFGMRDDFTEANRQQATVHVQGPAAYSPDPGSTLSVFSQPNKTWVSDSFGVECRLHLTPRNM